MSENYSLAVVEERSPRLPVTEETTGPNPVCRVQPLRLTVMAPSLYLGQTLVQLQ